MFAPRGFVDTGSNETGSRGFHDTQIEVVSWPSLVRSAPVNIRYSTGGGIGPNEMETLIWLDYLKSNVLKNYGKVYTVDMTFTRGSSPDQS